MRKKSLDGSKAETKASLHCVLSLSICAAYAIFASVTQMLHQGFSLK